MAHSDFQDARAEPLERLGALGGDGAPRQLAADEAVECHGVLWLLDEMHDAAVASIRQLYEGLTAIAEHPRCRLPRPKIRRRLADYAERLR